MADRSFLEWPFFDDHHRRLAVELDAWASSHLGASHGADVDAECLRLRDLLAEGGWLDYVVPREYGGRHEALDVRSLCIIRETLARHSGLADFVFAMQGLGSGAITLFGTSAQKAAYLPAVRRGEKTAAFALTELRSGSDVANMDTTARADGDDYLIDGGKTYISNGGIADFYTVFARTGEAPGARGISAIIVDADTPGLHIAERQEVIAPHPLATLRFERCRVPAGARVGQAGSGFKVAMATLDVFRSTVGAAALGFARRALDEALQRAAGRELFGGVLADQQIIQAMLAEMALDVDASALLVYRAGWTRDVTGRRVTREAAMAKLHATEAAQQTIDKAVQIFGGLGVVRGVPVEELYREIRALRIYEGATEVQKVVIARQVLAAAAAAADGGGAGAGAAGDGGRSATTG